MSRVALSAFFVLAQRDWLPMGITVSVLPVFLGSLFTRVV